uniref:Uncharacterized protein n=1 Tax=Rousettus aegyptiacus TaxID=9407 RepID=A0A7J8KBM8_ROUAE|nr:hypothetical protein HJG63_008051 [Rousettus aegyptiacus]
MNVENQLFGLLDVAKSECSEFANLVDAPGLCRGASGPWPRCPAWSLYSRPSLRRRRSHPPKGSAARGPPRPAPGPRPVRGPRRPRDDDGAFSHGVWGHPSGSVASQSGHCPQPGAGCRPGPRPDSALGRALRVPVFVTSLASFVSPLGACAAVLGGHSLGDVQCPELPA